ncbi:MAG: tetratricopeptide repeat protein [Spirochaetales bacterium]|nr:tetratricopeptide repeat protein [Spirochaetales bacterium]
MNPIIITSLNNLALLLQALGKYEEAESLFRKALAICENRLGKDHPSTI